MKSFYMKQPYADEQVRAIIEGRKTLLVEPLSKTIVDNFGLNIKPFLGRPSTLVRIAGEYKLKVGERYWLKECWQNLQGWDGADFSDNIVFRADDKIVFGDYSKDEIVWRPSIHMPQWASRFTMEVTRVYVKRVSDTSKDEAKMLGYEQPAAEGMSYKMGAKHNFAFSYRKQFGDDSWQRNDWCWFVKFKKV